MVAALVTGLLRRSTLLSNRTVDGFPEAGVCEAEVCAATLRELKARDKAPEMIKSSFGWKVQLRNDIFPPRAGSNHFLIDMDA
jgi:hypothetical protein